MLVDLGCDGFREVAPELALGIADGEERAAALDHLAGCADCRRYLSQLSATADELLLIAGEAEPPLGFETRVAEEIAPEPRTRRRWRLPMAIGAAAATAAAIAAVAMVIVYHDDHNVASSYRATLAEANGSYFTATPIHAPGGTVVGNAFAYQGDPSWVMMTVSAPPDRLPDGRYECELVRADGKRISLGYVDVRNGQGSYGASIPIALDNVREIRMLGPGRDTVLEAHPSQT